MTADQVLAALWRRKGLIAAIAAVVFAIGAAVVITQPSLYEATVVVRVEPQRPTPEMVQRTVSEQIEDRLLTVREELLARPVLQKAIEEFNLYPELVEKKGVEAAVEQMRKDITVKVEGQNAFEMTYVSRDPETAAKVANRLPEVFAAETLKIRQEQAARATTLFGDEVETLKKSLANWEQKIAKFKVDHIGELPEQMEANMRGMERIGTLLNTKSEELRVAEARRSDLARSRNAMDSEAGRLQATEDQLQAALVAAKTKWTADHPEVERIGKELEGVHARRVDAEGRMYADRAERARAVQLVDQAQRDILDLQKQADAYQTRLDHTPKWANELSVLASQYELVKAKYASVVSRKVEAELAEELEVKSAKSMFNVISPAGVPTAAAKPDRMTGLLLTLLIALGLAVLTGVVLELRDDSIRDTHEIKTRLPIPVLAVVPQMTAVRGEKRFLMPEKATQSSPPTIQ